MAGNEDIDPSSIMTPEEEEAWLGGCLPSLTPAAVADAAAAADAEANTTSIEEDMQNLAKGFEDGMQICKAALSASASEDNDSSSCSIRKVYSMLHSQADADLVSKLRLAMDGIPPNTKGLSDCRTYFSSKQHYTLQDILVAQYVLNDGLLMRQNQGTQDEYHVDITEPLVE